MTDELEEALFAIEPRWFDRDPRRGTMCFGFACVEPFGSAEMNVLGPLEILFSLFESEETRRRFAVDEASEVERLMSDDVFLWSTAKALKKGRQPPDVGGRAAEERPDERS